MVGERALLTVSPMKGMMRFGKKGKLSPRYIGPFEIVECIGEVAYRLALPPRWSGVHHVHISMLNKYHQGGSHVIQWDSVLLDQNLTFEKELITILDRQIRKLRSKEIASVRVRWKNRPVEEATWETESDMREKILRTQRVPVIVGGSNSYIEKLVEDPVVMFKYKYDSYFICIDDEQSVLNCRVDMRVDQMVIAGLVDDVRQIFIQDADYTKAIRWSIGVPEMERYSREETNIDTDNESK
ncbi:uncharacterized protein [Solanum lycopersicum]|uniref:uncharacterized protein n=1 Tax=Solanum lycopersicum TaxID=4081 RepID=UPI003748501F